MLEKNAGIEIAVPGKAMKRSLPHHRISRRRAASRGAVMVEYAFLLVAVAVPAMVGIALGGIGMLQKFERTRTQILDNSP